jgi:hypothetical protein
MFVHSLLSPLKKNVYSLSVSCPSSCALTGTRHSAVLHHPRNGTLGD